MDNGRNGRGELSLSRNESRDVWIDGKSDAFEDTPFAGSEFRICFKPWRSSQLQRIADKHQRPFKRNSAALKVDNFAILSETFVQFVTKWEGINDENGKPIECTAESRAWIAECYGALVVAAVSAATEEVNGQEGAKASLAKN